MSPSGYKSRAASRSGDNLVPEVTQCAHADESEVKAP